MLSFIKNFAKTLHSEAEAVGLTASDFVERRQTPRYGLRGREVRVSAPGMRATLQLRDLSCGGLSGITPLPAAVGDRVAIQLPVVGKRIARVCWVKSTLMGLEFETPLSLMSLVKIYTMHWDSARPFRLGGAAARLRRSGVAVNDDDPFPENDGFEYERSGDDMLGSPETS